MKMKARIPIMPLCNKLIYRFPVDSLLSEKVLEVQVRSPVAKNEFTWGARAGQSEVGSALSFRPAQARELTPLRGCGTLEPARI